MQQKKRKKSCDCSSNALEFRLGVLTSEVTWRGPTFCGFLSCRYLNSMVVHHENILEQGTEVAQGIPRVGAPVQIFTGPTHGSSSMKLVLCLCLSEITWCSGNCWGRLGMEQSNGHLPFCGYWLSLAYGTSPQRNLCNNAYKKS